MMLYNPMKFHENILKDFQVIERTLLPDGQTDGQTTKAKTICLNPFSGRHRYILHLEFKIQKIFP